MSRKNRPRLTREAAIAALEDLYAQLPALECKGRCFDSCTAVDASELERKRMRERGVELPMAMAHHRLQALIAAGRTPRCPALGPLNTCTGYEVRPFTCRAFGMVRDPADHLARGPMMCDYGCIPDGTIGFEQFARALREIEEMSQEVTGVSRRPTGPEQRGMR
jgi:Fe-S-cluster containining protein